MRLVNPEREQELGHRLALWLALGAFVAYWWLVGKALRELLAAARDFGTWARERT